MVDMKSWRFTRIRSAISVIRSATPAGMDRLPTIVPRFMMPTLVWLNPQSMTTTQGAVLAEGSLQSIVIAESIWSITSSFPSRPAKRAASTTTCTSASEKPTGTETVTN